VTENRPPLDLEAAVYLKAGDRMLCFACRASGRCQFGLEQVLPDGDRRLIATLSCPANFEGGPGVAHGGWTAAAFDEILGHMGPFNGALTVTGGLCIDYLKPVPISRPLQVRAWVDRVEGRKWFIEGEMTLIATGALLGRAHGVFIERKAEHFDNHRKWMEAQDKAAG
jgi:acyl-coenzyme A thioesterase PaaI-like protein